MVRTSVIQLAACVCFFPYFGNICNLLLKMPGKIFICWHTIHDIPKQMRARAYPCFISMVEQACLYFSLMFLFSTAGFPPPPPPPFNTPPWHFIKFSKVCTLSTTRVNFLGHKHATMTLAWILNSLYNQTLTWSTRYVMILSLICHQCQLRTSKGWYEVIIHQFFVLKMMI